MTSYPYDPNADGWNTGKPWTESCILEDLSARSHDIIPIRPKRRWLEHGQSLNRVLIKALQAAAARGETLEEIAVFIQRNEGQVLERR